MARKITKSRSRNQRVPLNNFEVDYFLGKLDKDIIVAKGKKGSKDNLLFLLTLYKKLEAKRKAEVRK